LLYVGRLQPAAAGRGERAPGPARVRGRDAAFFICREVPLIGSGFFKNAMELAHRLDMEEPAWCEAAGRWLVAGFEDVGEPFLMFGAIEEQFVVERGVSRDEARTRKMVALGLEMDGRLNRHLMRQGPCFRFLEGCASAPAGSLGGEDAVSLLPKAGLSENYWVLRGTSVGGGGLVVGLDLKRAPGAREAARMAAWTRAVMHLGAAWRLRKALGRGEGRAEAVLSPGEPRVLHAEGAALDPEMREVLRRAARELERSRVKRGDLVGRLMALRVLVVGRWSLVDHTDHDGKRMVLAQVNKPATPAELLPGLGERERQVAMLLALGHSLKEIGYELGLAVSTVHGAELRARVKLGAPGRAAMIQRVHEATDGLLRLP